MDTRGNTHCLTYPDVLKLHLAAEPTHVGLYDLYADKDPKLVYYSALKPAESGPTAALTDGTGMLNCLKVPYDARRKNSKDVGPLDCTVRTKVVGVKHKHTDPNCAGTHGRLVGG